MAVNWLDVTDIPFQALLLLERAQLNWLPIWGLRQPEWSLALAANPVVAWYLRHKAPELCAWLDQPPPPLPPDPSPAQVRQAERVILAQLNDLLVYALDPAIYDRQPFLNWDSNELLGLADFRGKRVIDVGSGTGRLAFTVTELARVVYAVEPVGNLRDYLRAKAVRLGCRNFYALDGLITRLPFEDGFADIVMSGHVFGDEPEAEWAELLRVTRPGGMVILCPGNNDVDNAIHGCLVGQGAAWSAFEEPEDGLKRKYWKVREE